MEDPDVIMLVDGDSADIADYPVMPEWPRPRWIEHKARCRF